jgi:hypothetical protein
MAVAPAVLPQQPGRHGQHHHAADHHQGDPDAGEAQCSGHQLRPDLQQVEHADGRQHGADGVNQQ